MKSSKKWQEYRVLCLYFIPFLSLSESTSFTVHDSHVLHQLAVIPDFKPVCFLHAFYNTENLPCLISLHLLHLNLSWWRLPSWLHCINFLVVVKVCVWQSLEMSAFKTLRCISCYISLWKGDRSKISICLSTEVTSWHSSCLISSSVCIAWNRGLKMYLAWMESEASCFLLCISVCRVAVSRAGLYLKYSQNLKCMYVERFFKMFPDETLKRISITDWDVALL